MIGLLCFVLAVLASTFKSKMRLEAENAVLRHQLIVLRRKLRGRVQLANSDRWFLVQLYHWFPSILQVLTIIRPETLIRWHRSGFRCYWRWKSRSLGGQPQIEMGLRALIRQMSMENPLWGAPRIHGELLKLGFTVAQSSVAKYMVKRRGPPGQGWLTFLRNHAPDIAAMDLFVVPTIGFNLLYAFVIVRLDRRDLVWINVDANQSDPENVESRIWRPSIPVIHIAASVAVVISNSERAGIPQTSWGDILHSRPLVEEIVHNAQLYPDSLKSR